METVMFIGQRAYNYLKGLQSIRKLEEAVVSFVQTCFLDELDPEELTLTTAGYGPEDVLRLKLSLIFDDRADHEIVHRGSFSPALELIKYLSEPLDCLIGNVIDELTIFVTVEIKLVRQNRIYDTFYYRGKAMLSKDNSKIEQEYTGASST